MWQQQTLQRPTTAANWHCAVLVHDRLRRCRWQPKATDAPSHQTLSLLHSSNVSPATQLRQRHFAFP